MQMPVTRHLHTEFLPDAAIADLSDLQDGMGWTTLCWGESDHDVGELSDEQAKKRAQKIS